MSFKILITLYVLGFLQTAFAECEIDKVDISAFNCSPATEKLIRATILNLKKELVTLYSHKKLKNDEEKRKFEERVKKYSDLVSAYGECGEFRQDVGASSENVCELKIPLIKEKYKTTSKYYTQFAHVRTKVIPTGNDKWKTVCEKDYFPDNRFFYIQKNKTQKLVYTLLNNTYGLFNGAVNMSPLYECRMRGGETVFTRGVKIIPRAETKTSNSYLVVTDDWSNQDKIGSNGLEKKPYVARILIPAEVEVVNGEKLTRFQWRVGAKEYFLSVDNNTGKFEASNILDQSLPGDFCETKVKNNKLYPSINTDLTRVDLQG